MVDNKEKEMTRNLELWSNKNMWGKLVLKFNSVLCNMVVRPAKDGKLHK